MHQITGWESNVVKKGKESADLGHKIADKRQKRSDTYLKLQRAEQTEQKKAKKATESLMNRYEDRINDLQKLLFEKSHNQDHKDIVLDSDVEYDVFVSHAYEDKEDFVDEFVEKLQKLGLKVWYDTNKLQWGDSMREKIDSGLSKSKYGVVILSPNYIAENKYWTKTELNGLFQMETINGKTILPIWHNLTKKQVMEYSPIIADRKAMTTAMMTDEEIAAELNELFYSQDENENI